VRIAFWIFLILVGIWGGNFLARASGYQETSPEEEILYLELANIAAGHPQSTCKAPSTVSVISAERIRDMGARTVLDALRLVPGLITGMDIQGIPIVSLRGVYSPGSERILFLLDGIPVNNNLIGSGTLFFADLSVDKIERIEIIRGPGSVLYGSEAFTGVINIILKKGFIDQLSYRHGSYDIDEVNFAWDKAFNDFSFWFDFDHRDQNSFSLPIKHDRFDSNPLFVKNANIPRYRRTSDWLRREEFYTGFSFHNFIFESFYINHADGLSYNLSGVPSDHSRFARQKFWSSLFYKKEASPFLWQSILNFDYTYIDLFVDFYPPGTSLIDSETKTKYFFPYGLKWRRKADLYRFRLENKLQFSFKKHHLLAGLVLQYDDLDDPEYYENVISYSYPLPYRFHNIPDLKQIFNFDWISPENRFYYSLYFQDEFSFRDILFLTFGTRYDNYDDIGDNISFRLAAILSLLDTLYLKFLYGEGFRAPSFRELYIRSCPVMPRSGNPNLDPETMRSYEFSIFYNKKSFEANVTFFYQKYKDLISLVPNKYLNFSYKNFSNTTSTYGLEAEIKWFWGPVRNNYLTFSYAYLDHNDIRTFYIVPYHVFFLNLNQYLLPRFSINYSLSYISDWNNKIDSYFLSNIVFHYFHPLGEFHLGVYNIFDKKYRYPDFTHFYPDNYLRPGRIIEAKFVYYF